MRVIRRFVFLILPLIMLAVIAAFLVFATENKAAVTNAQAPTTADATRAKSFAKRSVDQLLNAKTPTILSVREQDLDSVFALMNSAVHQLSGNAMVSQRGLTAEVTYILPKNPWRNFINIHFGLKPSTSGVDFTPLSIGKLKIPGRTAASMIRFGLNFALGDDAGDQFLTSVTWVRFAKSTAKLRIEPVSDLKARLHALAKRLGEVRDDVALLGDPARIRVYYAKLVEVEKSGDADGAVSLTRYMTPLFSLARDRGGDAAQENQAALLALVIFFGDARFERLTGTVRTGALKGHRRKNADVLLGGRRDLLLHFTISAGLQLVSDHGVAMAIGEFKELLDSAGGGTGFSFVDLAADRSGVRFAEVAVRSGGSSRGLQRNLAVSSSERDFFPDFKDLVEGLSDTAFERQFGGVDDPRYKAVVQKIDRRLSVAPAYSEH
jgi:hypothetical protein